MMSSTFGKCVECRVQVFEQENVLGSKNKIHYLGRQIKHGALGFVIVQYNLPFYYNF